MPIQDRVPQEAFLQQTSVVGLELDPGHVAAAEVTVNGRITLTRGAVAELRPGIMRDGEVADPIALAEALKALFAEHDLPKRVRLGIANQRIVVRTLDLAAARRPEGARRRRARRGAGSHPDADGRGVLDFQPLGVVQTRRSACARASSSSPSAARWSSASPPPPEGAGLQLEGIDLSAFGMVRALASEHEGAVLYINVAGLDQRRRRQRRAAACSRAPPPAASSAIAQTLAERRGLTLEHARQWMTHVGLAAPLEGVEGDAGARRRRRARRSRRACTSSPTRVRNSLNFYRTQDAPRRSSCGVVTGPAVAIPGFVERLGEQLRLPLEARVVAGRRATLDAGRLTVAAGLAVAERP